ncbi:hypothetical protein FF011L_12850 [Roseimaritima multifibrata]|uniref:Uncharacterized protein n=1 Tax=Roseimaritima multifibrata TaxID=1930274 RepID=A0A517MCB4_9BACT|nr:hypothetical protein [Roseimaritima multifibrata]QDS92538.1 hypothetical protein FF011L_12850 [Roseimaritima multifibrata]
MSTAIENAPVQTQTQNTTNRVANSNRRSQNETVLSDIEIAARVLAIRSSWDVNERLQRRRAADERFENLLDALQLTESAA